MHAKHLIVCSTLRRSIGPIVANTGCPKIENFKNFYYNKDNRIDLFRWKCAFFELKPIFKKLQMTKIACVG